MSKNPSRMRYKNDSAPARLCYLSIVFNIAYFITLYSNQYVIPDLSMGADVVINIVFMLAAFWAGEMVKVYDGRWAYGMLALGIVQIGRIFWLPLKYKELGQLADSPFAFVCAALALSGAVMAVGAVISRKNSAILRRYLRQESSAKAGDN